jgi:predicted nucleic-acid-binding protein
VIALDTNILVRAILQDDVTQSPKAIRAIEELAVGEGIFITTSVVLELAWVLRKKKHPAEIYEILHHLLESEGVTFASADLIGEALEIFRAGKIDFGDALLLTEAQSHGVSKVITFDEMLIKCDQRAVALV